MKLRYLGDPNERAAGIAATTPVIQAYGVTFVGPYFDRAAEVVDVSHLPQWQQEKLARNNHFEVVEAGPEPLPEGTVIDEGDPEEAAAVAAHAERAKTRKK